MSDSTDAPTSTAVGSTSPTPGEDEIETLGGTCTPTTAGVPGRGGRRSARRPFTLDYRLQRWDGEYRWILDHGLPRTGTDGSVIGYIGSATDVTELKTAQQVVAETNALRSAIFGSLYGHVAALDRHVLDAVNDRGCASRPRTAQMRLVSQPTISTFGARRRGDADARRAAAASTPCWRAAEHGEIEYHATRRPHLFGCGKRPSPRGQRCGLPMDVTRRRRRGPAHQQRGTHHTLRDGAGWMATSLAEVISRSRPSWRPPGVSSRTPLGRPAMFERRRYRRRCPAPGVHWLRGATGSATRLRSRNAVVEDAVVLARPTRGHHGGP
jgi:hypothetical protein